MVRFGSPGRVSLQGIADTDSSEPVLGSCYNLGALGQGAWRASEVQMWVPWAGEPAGRCQGKCSAGEPT